MGFSSAKIYFVFMVDINHIFFNSSDNSENSLFNGSDSSDNEILFTEKKCNLVQFY